MCSAGKQTKSVPKFVNLQLGPIGPIGSIPRIVNNTITKVMKLCLSIIIYCRPGFMKSDLEMYFYVQSEF